MCGRVSHLCVAFPCHIAKVCEKFVNFKRIFLYEPCGSPGAVFVTVFCTAVERASCAVHKLLRTGAAAAVVLLNVPGCRLTC